MKTALWLGIGALLVGCNTRPGLGGGTGQPLGDPFNLPAQITIPATILGDDAPACQPAMENRLGSSNLVSPCFTLHNSSGVDTQVIFPPRLVFVSKDDSAQNGLIVEGFTVTVPGGGVLTVRLGLFCLNLHREPSHGDDVYALGPLTTEPGLEEIIDSVQAKNISTSTVLVQNAVWEVTEENGLKEATRAALSAL